MTLGRNFQFAFRCAIVAALGLALGLVPTVANAQRAGSHPAAIVRHPIQHPRAFRPARIAPIRIGRQPFSIQRPMVRTQPMRTFGFHQRRVMTVRRLPGRAPRVVTFRPIVTPRITITRSFEEPVPAPRLFISTGRFSRGHFGIVARSGDYYNWLAAGEPFISPIGYPATNRTYEMLPLGAGMWPACDSAAVPGRFWTTAPCFGLGYYPAAQPGITQQEPVYYQTVIIEEPTIPPTPGAKKPTPPANKAKMKVYLTDGRQFAVSDWWVTQGRFFFTTYSGATQSVDLPVLDLKKTIEENEKQGLTFILNFTPPSERPQLPAPVTQ